MAFSRISDFADENTEIGDNYWGCFRLSRFNF